MIRRLLLVALVLALTACGFQLRDALLLPPDLGPVKVRANNRYSPLAESLAQALTRAGAVPATEDMEDPTVLDLLAEKWGDTPISVDARGRAQEFSLRYAVVFELRKGDGTVVVPRQSIELSRDYISVPTNSIGTEGERDILVRELQREMSASILRRIDAVARRIQERGSFVPEPAQAPAAQVTAEMAEPAAEPVSAPADQPDQSASDTPR